MAVGRERKTSELNHLTSVANTDYLIGVANVSSDNLTFSIKVGDLFSNVSNFSVLNLQIQSSNTPSSNSVSPKGSIWFDTNFLYVAVANNVIKKVALSAL